MKELSIEEKAKAYDEALKVLHKYDGANIMFTQDLKEEMFPELKESKDERIKNGLVKLLNCIAMKEYEDIFCITKEEALAWVEKQGKEETDEWKEGNIIRRDGILALVIKGRRVMKSNGEIFTVQYPDEWVKAVPNEIEHFLNELEKQGEQKPESIVWHKVQPKEYVLEKTLIIKKNGELDMVSDTILSVTDAEYALPVSQLPKPKSNVIQGEQKPYGQRQECVDCQFNYAGECKGSCAMKRSEQKLADKVEPKFKVGNWITNGDYIWKIVEVKPFDYILQSQDGNVVDDTISHVDEQFHSFTIDDAKEGDVLAALECYVIFKEIDGLNIKCYCTYHYMGFNPSFYVDTLQNKNAFYPATKEQREQLEKAMADAGYTFDFEKKELKKIEQKPVEWSEEDELMLESIIQTLKLTNGAAQIKIDWLESLKEKVALQKQWKPSEEQMEALRAAKVYPSSERREILETLYKDLEQLKAL